MLNRTLEWTFYPSCCIAKTNICFCCCCCLPQCLKIKKNQQKYEDWATLHVQRSQYLFQYYKMKIVAFYMKKKFWHTWYSFKYVVWRISPAFVFIDIISPFKTFEITVTWIHERGPNRFTGNIDAYATNSLQMKQNIIHLWHGNREI